MYPALRPQVLGTARLLQAAHPCDDALHRQRLLGQRLTLYLQPHRPHLGDLPCCRGLTSLTPGGDTLRVREVWQENLEEEMDIIRNLVDDYPFLAMDTEFPGVVARPVGAFKNTGEYHFQTLR